MRVRDLKTESHEQHSCSSPGFTLFTEKAIEQSLCERFAEQVAVHRSCLAVSDSKYSLAYGELDGWANGIARVVLDRSPHSAAPVSLIFAQGAASIAAIMGTLKSGRAYVSLEPGDPRGASIVDDVNATLVLTDEEHRAEACAVAGSRSVVVVDEIGAAEDPGIETTPDTVAYVFYTSGSTGRPKGVYDTHRNVLHNALRYTNTLNISPTDRLSLVQSPSFSGTVSSLFSALLNGAAVFPFRTDQGGVTRLASWVNAEQITIYHSVPTIFRALLRSGVQSFPDVRVVRLEGDRAASLDVELHRRHFGGGSVLVNGLGLTETGLVRQYFVDRELPIEHGILPVGYPVRDVDVLIIGEDAQEVPAGVRGEIAVRSRYLALGYWNEPELTSEKFLQAGEARLYLTGDLGRVRDDGCLEYLGRRDGGFKVLGHRVEPAEVEAELVRLPGVAEAAVVTREGRRGEGQLVAFVVADGHVALRASDIRAAVAARLPRHMVPSVVSTVNELPLGSNGKVDRRALPDAPSPSASRPPVDDLERVVARVWEDVLDVHSVGADDDFFALGGDSLAAAEIFASLEHETGVPLPVSVLLGSPTVASLADALRIPRAAMESPLVVLRSGGDLAPLVLVHGNTGNLLHYHGLVRLLDRGRPVWGLEHMGTDDLSLDRIAARHVRSLVAENPSGPFLVVGFCFGAVVAHEIACQLRTEGHEVLLLGLLGVTPLEFPTLVPPLALDRWSRRSGAVSGFLPLTCYHLGAMGAMPAREWPRYFTKLLGKVGNRARARVGGRRLRQPSVAETLQSALFAHQPATYPGTALLVLHEGDTAVYTDDPEDVWAKLAENVDLEMLPGVNHAMLEIPGSVRLAELIHQQRAQP